MMKTTSGASSITGRPGMMLMQTPLNTSAMGKGNLYLLLSMPIKAIPNNNKTMTTVFSIKVKIGEIKETGKRPVYVTRAGAEEFSLSAFNFPAAPGFAFSFVLYKRNKIIIQQSCRIGVSQEQIFMYPKFIGENPMRQRIIFLLLSFQSLEAMVVLVVLVAVAAVVVVAATAVMVVIL